MVGENPFVTQVQKNAKHHDSVFTVHRDKQEVNTMNTPVYTHS